MLGVISITGIVRMDTYLAISLLAVIGSVCGGTPEFPSFIKPCTKSEDINQCIKDNIELCKPHMKKGIPKLAIPPLDPLELPTVALESANFNLQCEEFSLTGLEALKLNDVKLDIDKSTFDIDLTVPYVEIKSKYTIKGKILVLQLDGSGPLYLNLTNIHFQLKFSGKHEDKDGKMYISFDESDVKLDGVDNVFIQLNNLFGSNEELTKTTNDVFNENMPTLLDELRPLFERAVGDVVTNIIQKFFHKYSVDQLLV